MSETKPGPDEAKRLPKAADDDVEGHKHLPKAADDGGPEGARRLPSFDGDDDVEGHGKHLPK